jgi:hypothetical protein
MKTRSDKNSVTAAIGSFNGAIAAVPVPEGVEFRTDDERIIWDQFTRARAREDWRDMDLLSLAKIVQMEADIRRYQHALDIEGVIITNQRGTKIVNPLCSVVDMLSRRQLSYIRSMSLNQQHSDPRTINASAKVAQNARAVIDDVADDDLIAIPQRAN